MALNHRVYLEAYEEGYGIVLDTYHAGLVFCPLSTLDWERMDKKDTEEVYHAIASDGCTGVPDFYVCACIKHDFWYAAHQDFNGDPIDREEADRRFRLDIQRQSKLGFLSPMSWWRWAAVRLMGSKAWEKKQDWRG